MKQIKHTKRFKKHLRQRFGHRQVILLKLEQRLVMLQQEKLKIIHDHALIGEMKGLRAFSVTGDIRVVYRENEDGYTLVDIGSHAQVYKI